MSQSLLLALTLAAAGPLSLGACSRNGGAAPVTGGGSAPKAGGGPAPATARAQRIDVAVTSEGFVPARTRVKVGQPVTLVVTRKLDETCVKDIVIQDYGVRRPLPLNQAVEVTFTPRKAGKIRYACAMDMVAGELVAE